MMGRRTLRKLALLCVLMSLLGLVGQSKPAEAWNCEVLPCPEYWDWIGCQVGCACVSEQCCLYYGGTPAECLS